MANEVAKPKSNALAAAGALKKNLSKVQTRLPETRGSGFMSFGRDGVWTHGQANEEVREGEEVAINPLSIETGFICWSDRGENGPTNEVLGEVMVPLGEDAPLKHTLPVKEDKQSVKAPEWRDQIKVTMRLLDGPNKGTQVTYSTTSVGGIGALKGLIDQIMLQLDEDPANIVPVVTLGSDHYKHKKWGKTYTPEISIVDFISLDDEPESDEDGDEEEQPPADEKKPARSRSRKPKPAPEEDAGEDDVIDGTAEEIEEAEEEEVEETTEAPKRTRTRTRRR